MRRVVAPVLLVAVLVVASVIPAQAGTSTDVALGLASFAVFNQVVGTFARPHYVVHREVVVARPAFVYAPPVVVYRPPVYAPPIVARPQPTVVQYPTGRYELRWQGAQYVWVWIPNMPAIPPAPPAPPY
jgi:hypothetical protein